MSNSVTTSTGLALAYTWHGNRALAANKPVLVLTHALGMNQLAWEPIINLLRDKFIVLTWDLPGHGKSTAIEPNQDNFTHESLTQCCLELLDSLGVDSFYFAGTSIGGVVGLSLLNECPKRIKGMLLSNTGAIIGTAQAWQARCQMIVDIGLAESSSEIVPRWFSETSIRNSPSLLERWKMALGNVDQHSYLSLCHMLANTDLSSTKRHNVEVRLVAGAADLATPVQLLVDLAEQLASENPIVFLDVGHIPSIEAPESFAAVVHSLMEG